MAETMSKDHKVKMTPDLDRRLRKFARERGWSVGAAIRYFLEDGLEGDARRAKLASQAVTRRDEEQVQALAAEFE